jgi:hypothetical protein
VRIFALFSSRVLGLRDVILTGARESCEALFLPSVRHYWLSLQFPAGRDVSIRMAVNWRRLRFVPVRQIVFGELAKFGTFGRRPLPERFSDGLISQHRHAVRGRRMWARSVMASPIFIMDVIRRTERIGSRRSAPSPASDSGGFKCHRQEPETNYSRCLWNSRCNFERTSAF